MPLNKLENFLKNVEGRIIYVSPADLDSTDSILNEGNSQTRPFKTLQRALLEAARFSYNVGSNNDITEKTTILLMPGDHLIDNRPGWSIEDNSGNPVVKRSDGSTANVEDLNLKLETNFDITQENNILYKFNSVNGGVIVPRGTSIVGLDLRKTKIRPKYVPNPLDTSVPYSAIFRLTGACYLWQFSIFDGDETDKVYINNENFENVSNLVSPTFSHHKLTAFEYADGVNEVASSGITDLDMYYYKLSRAYNSASNRNISEKYPDSSDGFAKQRPEWEIVGAFAPDPITITKIQSGDIAGVATNKVTVTTKGAHGLSVGTPIKIRGVNPQAYNISTKVVTVDDTLDNVFTYTLPDFDKELQTLGDVSGANVTIETDTVSGASPYIFNISMRSVWGMNGMHADGSKASGFRSMVVAQFTGVSLQKDDRAFVKYNKSNRSYEGNDISFKNGGTLALESSQTDTSKAYHLDSGAIYRKGWQSKHVNITNDAILQIVSVFAIGFSKHFNAESGGDASITNSNSNFGQLALVSDGFKKDAFAKDDNAFITHVITPKAINEDEENVDWVQLNVGLTTEAANAANNRLYLSGYTSKNIKPPSLTQGFRIGAKDDDELYLLFNEVEYKAKILMSDGSTSARKKIEISSLNNNTNLFTSVENHGLTTGEKLIIVSTDGDLPEGLQEHRTYFANVIGVKTFKLCESLSDAENNINVSCNSANASNLTLFSRVTDKESGDIGHPIQFDEDAGNWFIHTEDSSGSGGIYNIIDSQGVSGIGEKSELTYFKRISDSRSLDDKIFKMRVSVPKEVKNGKNIQNGFILQESSSTGVRTDGDLTLTSTLTADDFDFERNQRFISSCTYDSGSNKVTIAGERPHNLQVGDSIKIEGIRSSNNTNGTFKKDYNIETTVTDIVNNMEFKYTPTTVSTQPTTDFNLDKESITGSASTLPKYTRKDLQSNIYFYRHEVLSDYTEDERTGLYHAFPVLANVEISEEFTGSKYSQTVVDLYPQLDRDNVNDSPRASKSFAKRFPIGDVVTNDLQKSITRESTDELMRRFGVVLDVSSVTNLSSNTIAEVTFERNHNISGLGTGTVSSSSSGYNNGTFNNVKVIPNSSSSSYSLSDWTGTLANVTVSGGSIDSFEITNPGAGFTAGFFGHFDENAIGNGANGYISNDGGSSNALVDNQLTGRKDNLVIQFTGSGITTDSYFRTLHVPAANKIAIARTDGDPNITTSQYGFIVGKAIDVTYTVNSGTVTVTTVGTAIPHGLVKGNRFQINDDSNNNLETLIVEDVVTIKKFTAKTTKLSGTNQNGYVLKHGLSANDSSTGKNGENLDVRGVPLYGFENARLGSAINADTTTLTIDLLDSQTGVDARFPYGSYIQIDDEIMRIASNTSTGGSVTVLRAVFGTNSSSHINNSAILALKPIPFELHRPSILRASGHTFEYLGYGPGNYSTGLPQVQVKTLTEREEFLSQAQETSAGQVVYTGMNDKGDFYIGNQKKSSLTGEETTFDNPVPTVAGEDPSRLSVVFDEVIVKERLVVEGGTGNNILSQFDGPVSFTKDVTVKGTHKVKNSTNSESVGTGALTVEGGVGIKKDVFIGGNLDVDDDATIGNNLNVVGIATLGSLEVSDITEDHVVVAGTNGELEGSSNLTYDSATTDGGLTISNTTQSTSNNTGALVVSGGVGIAKSLTVSGAVKITGAKLLTFNDDKFSIKHGGTNAKINNTAGDLDILNSAGAIDIDGTEVDIDATAGAVNMTATGGLLKLKGEHGVRIVGITTFTNITQNTIGNVDTGSVQLDGGAGIAKNLSVGGDLDVDGATTLDGLTVDGNIDAGTNTVTAATFSGQATNADKVKTKKKDSGNNHFITFVDSNNNTAANEIIYTDAGIQYNPTNNQLELKGDIIAYAGSDERLKDNINPIADAVNKVKSLRGVTYEWNENSNREGQDTGVIAQEVAALGLPGTIQERDNGYLAVRYEKLIPLLIEAIKDLNDKVDYLEQKLSDK